ncbi:MAG: hypothetical protein AABX95_02735 [Nanoarchaeota archaeon]
MNKTIITPNVIIIPSEIFNFNFTFLSIKFIARKYVTIIRTAHINGARTGPIQG